VLFVNLEDSPQNLGAFQNFGTVSQFSGFSLCKYQGMASAMPIEVHKLYWALALLLACKHQNRAGAEAHL
jgi:hypothetical protein